MSAIALRDDAKLIIEEISDDLRMALPSNIPLERFKATFITAVAHNPDILLCDAQSIKTALMKSAADNLLPDNREAALVPFNTKVTDPVTKKESWKKLAQYMPMVQGIRKRALELGGARITAECVYENDHFDAVLGDDPHIEHKPAKLGQPRGEIIGVYAIFKDGDGNVLHREIMSKEDVESTRKVSKSANGPAWNAFFSEMARKAAVRRGAKSVPALPDNLRTVIERDDEYVDFAQVAEKPRTIEHNPLLESKPSVPMDRVDAATGEIIETKSSSSSKPPVKAAVEEGGGAGTDKAVEAVPTNSSQASSSLPGDDKAAASGTPPTDAAAADHAMNAAQLIQAAKFLARQDTPEKIEKATDSIRKGSETVPPPNNADLRLLAAFKAKVLSCIKDGSGTADELDAFIAHVEGIFGVDNFPGDR